MAKHRTTSSWWAEVRLDSSLRPGSATASADAGGRITLVDCARTHLWKPMLHSVAAGSIDPGEYEVDYLAQAHWHGFRYRFGELVGLDRTAKQIHLAAMLDDEGHQITPRTQRRSSCRGMPAASTSAWISTSRRS